MKIRSILGKLKLFYLKQTQTEAKWHRAFETSFRMPSNGDATAQNLRLVLGAGRSGTSWLARTLASTESPIRYCHEFLTYVRPKYFFSKKNDYTATPYFPELAAFDPLVKLYKYTTLQNVDWEKLMPKYSSRQIHRDDADFKFVLHKEVHALLATEGLLSQLKCPAIVITRNPIYNVDSLFNYQPLSSIIWRNEAEYIKDPLFLERFVPENKKILTGILEKYPDDGKNRTNVIISKIVTVASINKMLRTISAEYDNIMHIEYENLCKQPKKLFKECADFLEFEFGTQAQNNLDRTLIAKEKSNPMSICRDSQSQADRKLYFLSPEEVDLARKIITECDLVESNE